MSPNEPPDAKPPDGRRRREPAARASATIAPTPQGFRTWVLASAAQVEQTTSLPRKEVDKALNAIATVIPDIVTIRTVRNTPDADPLDGCGTNVCTSQGGPGGNDPCEQDSDCPTQTSCTVQVCEGEACVDHLCGTNTCAEQGCSENFCATNTCVNNECAELEGRDCPEQITEPCATQDTRDCVDYNCESHDCRDHSCDSYFGTPGEPGPADDIGLLRRTGGLAASIAWGKIVAAVAAAAPDSLARARQLQVTLTQRPKP